MGGTHVLYPTEISSTGSVPIHCTTCEVSDYTKITAGAKNKAWKYNTTLENKAYLEFVVSFIPCEVFSKKWVKYYILIMEDMGI